MANENARNGLGKIFTGEILAIIAEACAASYLIPVVGPIIGGLGYTILTIISTILLIVGLNIAGKDSEQIKKGFSLAIIQLIVSIVFGGLLLIPSIQDWIGSVGLIIISILELVIIYNIIYGCVGLNSALKEKADSTWKIFMIAIIIDIIIIIADAIITIMGLSVSMAVVETVLTIVDAVIAIIACIFFISFLNRAKNEV